MERVAELNTELEAARRLWRRRRRDTVTKARATAPEEPTVAPVEGLAEQDQAAVDTWPPELRARLRDRALTRQIMSRHRDDPGGYGMRNDLRNRR